MRSNFRYLEPFSFELILIEHESKDQPTMIEGFQMDILYLRIYHPTSNSGRHNSLLLLA